MRLYFFFALSGLCFCSLQAQQPDEHLSVYSYNVKYLEHLIKEKVDSVRIAHALLRLYNDTIIYKAAKYHAAYLFDLGDLSHSEVKNKTMETPQKRVDHFGAVNYLVGENIAYTAAGRPLKDKKTGKVYTNVSYNQVANDIVIGWVHSPGHYKNIITADYNATGVAVWTDEQTGRIYAVQNFAQILYKYEFTEDKNFFSYSNYVSNSNPVTSFEGISQQLHKGKHVHKLKTQKRVSDCNRCIDTSFHFAEYSKIQYRKGNVYYTCFDLMWIYQMLERKKDGFAVEVVAYNPYDCGNPAYYSQASRRNNQCVFSGKVLKPVYKKKAIKGFKAGTDRKKILKKIQAEKVERYEIKLGKIPKHLQLNYSELNLVVIQNKRVCRIVKFSDFESDTMKPAYTGPLLLLPIDTTNRFLYYNSKAAFKIPFLKGKAEYKASDIKPFTDSLLSANFVIDSLQIQAYASVEGAEAINQKLLEARANQIQLALQAHNKSNFHTTVSTEENWRLFEAQINENAALKEFRNLSHAAIKQKLEDTVQQKKLEPFLQQQRSMQIQLWAKVQIDENTVKGFIAKQTLSLKRAIDSILIAPDLNNSVLERYCDSLKRYMNTAAYYCKTATAAENVLRHFKLQSHPALINYELYRLNLFAHCNKTILDSVPQALSFYSDVTALYNKGQHSFFTVYTMLSIIQRYQHRMKTTVSNEVQEQLITELQKLAVDSLSRFLADKLALNFWFSMCDKPWDEVPVEKRALYERSLKTIHAYYDKKILSKEEDNRLARFYCYHSQFEWAYDRLIGYYRDRIENPEGIVILSKVLYQDYEWTRSDDYFEYLKDVYPLLGKEKWCPMFIGEKNISFQVLDSEKIRNFYCEKCSDYLNAAKRPEK